MRKNIIGAMFWVLCFNMPLFSMEQFCMHRINQNLCSKTIEKQLEGLQYIELFNLNKLIQLPCQCCLKKYPAAIKKRIDIYKNIIEKLSLLSPQQFLPVLLTAPRHIVENRFNNLSDSEQITYFTELTDDKQVIFLTKISPIKWEIFLKNISDEKRKNLLKDGVIHFIHLKKDIRKISFKNLGRKDLTQVLIHFWPDLDADEQTTYFQYLLTDSTLQDMLYLYLGIFYNHQLSETVITQYGKKLLSAITPLEKKFFVFHTIAGTLSIDIFGDLFCELCCELKIPVTIPWSCITTCINQFPKKIAVHHVKNFLSSYVQPSDHKEFVRLTISALDNTGRKIIFRELLSKTTANPDIDTLAMLCKDMAPDDVAECALLLYQKTTSVGKTMLFMKSTDGKYLVPHMKKLFETLSTGNLENSNGKIAGKFCLSLFTATQDTTYLTIPVKKFTPYPDIQHEFLSEISWFPFHIKQQNELLEPALNNPDLKNSLKEDLIVKYLNKNLSFYSIEKKDRFDLSKIFKEQIIELVAAQDIENSTDKKIFLKYVWSTTNENTQQEYFAYMSPCNKALLLTPKLREKLENFENTLSTWFEKRSKEEKCTRLLALPDGIFASFYQTLTDQDKKTIYEKLHPKKREELFKRLPTRNEWRFFGKTFPNLLNTAVPYALLFCSSKNESENMLQKMDLKTESVLQEILNLAPFLTKHEKKWLFCQNEKPRFFTHLFPVLSMEQIFDTLNKKNKKIEQNIAQKEITKK